MTADDELPVTPGELNRDALPALLGKDDPVILEVGCNDGLHTREFLRLFPHSTVYAFEPDPRVRLFDIAVSDVDGEIDFHMSNGAPTAECAAVLPKGWDYSGSIRKPTGHLDVHPWCTFDQIIKVKTRTLDGWCQQHGVDHVDFIWADVQGAEGDVIRGGSRALAKTRYLYTEYSDRPLYEGQIDLRTLLALLPDFTVVDRFAMDVLLKNTRYQAKLTGG